MESIQILKLEQDDMNVILLFTDEKLTGMNYHHGCDNINSHYLKNDPDLFGLFKRMRSGRPCEFISDIINTVLAQQKIQIISEQLNEMVNDSYDDFIKLQTQRLKESKLEMTEQEFDAIEWHKNQLLELLKIK